jgi:hypothetical protein
VAGREEGVSHYLGGLAPGSIVVCPEVWLVADAARLSWAATLVPSHEAPRGQPLYPYVERIGGRHILERLPRMWLDVPCRLGHYLGDLAACGVGVRTEVRLVWRAAWLSWHHAAWVPSDDAPSRHALYVEVEGAVGGHILEGLPGDSLIEPRGVSDYLRHLAACNVIIRAEGTIRIAPYDAPAGQALYECVKGAARWHV